MFNKGVFFLNSVLISSVLFFCDFETNFCAFEQAVDNNAPKTSWKLATKAPTAFTGPSSDHTTGHGKLLKLKYLICILLIHLHKEFI